MASTYTGWRMGLLFGRWPGTGRERRGNARHGADQRLQRPRPRPLERLHDPAARIGFADIAGDVGLGSWLTTSRVSSPPSPISPSDREEARQRVPQRSSRSTRSAPTPAPIPLGDSDRGCSEPMWPPFQPPDAASTSPVSSSSRHPGQIGAERHRWPKHWFYECLGLLTVATTPTDHWKISPSSPAPPAGRLTEPHASISDRPTSASPVGDRR